jgi:heme exporter protein D
MMLMDLGPHAEFIVVAYAVAVAVVAALIAWVLLDHRSQKLVLADLEARGMARRSEGKPMANVETA